MKAYSIEFRQQVPGGVKRVPVLTSGIEVIQGPKAHCPAVCLGNQNGWCREMPLMKEKAPRVSTEHLHAVVKDCVPLTSGFPRGRIVLAEPRHQSDRILLRIKTEAGDACGEHGTVSLRSGNAQRVAFGYTRNGKGVTSADVLVDVYPGATLVLIPGGTVKGCQQKYEVRCKGEISIVPIVLNGGRIQPPDTRSAIPGRIMVPDHPVGIPL